MDELLTVKEVEEYLRVTRDNIQTHQPRRVPDYKDCGRYASSVMILWHTSRA